MYGSLAGINLTTGIVAWFNLNRMGLFYLGLISLLLVIYQWWRDVSREGFLQGLHTAIVELGLRSGIVLFIISEVFFFFELFLSFFSCQVITKS